MDRLEVRRLCVLAGVGLILGGGHAVDAQGVPRSSTGSPVPGRARPTAPPLAVPLSARTGTSWVTATWLAEHDDSPWANFHEAHWSTDGMRLVLSTVDQEDPNGRVEIFEVATGARVKKAHGRAAGSPGSSSHTAVVRPDSAGDMQLWVTALDGSRSRQLTRARGGVGDPFDGSVNYAWSPDSRFLVYAFRPAFTRLIHHTATPAGRDTSASSAIEANAPIAAPEDTQVWLLDVRNGEVRRLSAIAGSVRALRWFPTGAEILVSMVHYEQEYPADSSFATLSGIRVSDGMQRTLATFDGMQQMLDPDISPDGARVAIAMDFDNDGYEIHSSLGVLPATLAEGAKVERLTYDVRLDGPRWSRGMRLLYATRNYGPYRRLYAVELPNGRSRQLTFGPSSVELFSLSHDRRQVALLRSNAHGRKWLAVARLDEEGRLDQERLVAEVRAPPPDLRLSEVRELGWTSADSVVMRGLVVMPLDYQPGTRYPLVVDIHGGGVGSTFPMQGSLLSSTPLEWQLWAARGYAVLVPDYRSTGSFGQQPVANALERNELERADIMDVLGGVDRLIQLDIADSGRLAVYGHSAGGVRTNWLVALSRRFHAAVSIEGNAEFYMLPCSGTNIGCSPGTRRLMGGWPWEVPERYRHASVIEHARGATTPTLFLMGSAHRGGLDQNLSVDFLYGALRRQGVEAKFVRYPDEGHGFLRAANRWDAVDRAVQWIDRYIGAHGNASSPSSR